MDKKLFSSINLTSNLHTKTLNRAINSLIFPLIK